MSFPARTRPTDRECPHQALGALQEESTVNSMARQMFQLVEPMGAVPCSADEPNEAMASLEPLATLLLAAQDT